eukprot:1194528-Prorocentrum_minimum.AAC.10
MEAAAAKELLKREKAAPKKVDPTKPKGFGEKERENFPCIRAFPFEPRDDQPIPSVTSRIPSSAATGNHRVSTITYMQQMQSRCALLSCRYLCSESTPDFIINGEPSTVPFGANSVSKENVQPKDVDRVLCTGLRYVEVSYLEGSPCIPRTSCGGRGHKTKYLHNVKDTVHQPRRAEDLCPPQGNPGMGLRDLAIRQQPFTIRDISVEFHGGAIVSAWHGPERWRSVGVWGE